MLRFLALLILTFSISCAHNSSVSDYPEPTILIDRGDSLCDEIFDLLTISGFDAIESTHKIPNTLNESFVELDGMINDQMKMWIRCLNDGEFSARTHFSLGMYLRNNWGLWGGSSLSQSFNDLGIFHPDDMSGIILDSYQRRLKEEDVQLQEQINNYREYWRSQEPGKDGQLDMSVPSLKDYN